MTIDELPRFIRGNFEIHELKELETTQFKANRIGNLGVINLMKRILLSPYVSKGGLNLQTI